MSVLVAFRRWAGVKAMAWALLALAAAPSTAFAQTNVAQTNSQTARFSVSDDRLVFDAENGDDSGDITEDDLDQLLAMLQANPDVRVLQLNSGGGGYYASLDMSKIVIDFELDTHVSGICESSCVLVFLGGNKRTMARGSKIGFHQKSWSSESIESYYDAQKEYYGWDDAFDYASWIYQDTQQESYLELAYMIRRGVKAEFAIETIKSQGDSIWHPYRAVLLAAGVLTE